MSSLAELPALVGFFSYSREDDEGSGGRLSKLRERIQEELRSQLGRTKADFRLWKDKIAIAHGELWEDTIKKGISEAVFFIPIITPTAVRSSYCKFEFQSFLAREKELERNNLIFPILYIPVPALTGDRWRQDPLLAIIGSRQYEDWQNLRHLDASSSEVVALRVQTFCANICRALEQEWLSPEERRRKAEAEERRRDEDERRRQEAEDRRRLAKAEKEKRRQDEERRRLEKQTKLATKEAQPQSEREPQQPDNPWLLPLIGAGAAFLPVLLIALLIMASTWQDPSFPLFMIIASLIAFLYGVVAGMLIRRFGILKAVAIPVIPYALLVVLFALAIFPSLAATEALGIVAIYVVPAVVCAWLAFWLHSRWARKPRLGEARG